MRTLIFFVSMLLTLACQPSTKGREEIKTPSLAESLVNTEKEFAQLSYVRSTKEAFLAFLDESGILFKPTAVNGIEFWNSNEDLGELLFWQPELATVSSAGDLGFTTGPFYLKPNRQSDSVAFSGHYASIWRKRGTKWKLLLDLGIGHDPVTLPDTAKTTVLKKIDRNSGLEMIDHENKFLSEFKEKGLMAYTNFISPDCHFLRSRSLPLTTHDQLERYFQQTDKSFVYTFKEGYTSTSNDLGYTFGQVEVEVRSMDNRKFLMHYLRIWTNGEEGWKISLDIIGS